MSLLRTAARVGVATSVHGKVSRRQQQRWAAQDSASTRASAPPAPPASAAPAGPSPMSSPPPEVPARSGSGSTADMLAQLTQLGELRAAGILTDAEFETQKARILAF